MNMVLIFSLLCCALVLPVTGVVGAVTCGVSVSVAPVGSDVATVGEMVNNFNI